MSPVVRQPHAYARQPADILTKLLALELVDAPTAMFEPHLKAYSGGRIFDFEYEIVRALQDLFYHGREKNFDRKKPEEVDRAAITAILARFNPDDEHYRWPFEQNAQGAYVGSSENFTVGKVYTLVECYVGDSWDGENCYVKVTDDKGSTYGAGYEQFMLADEYQAIHAARNATGHLTQLGQDCWTVFPVSEVNAHFADDTIERLIKAGAFKEIDDGDRRVVRLQDLNWKVKKAKAKRPAALILADALKRAIEAAEMPGMSNFVDADDVQDAVIDGHFNLEAISQAVIDDLGLEKHL
uniref:Uncharacterized protein n=1 Tax=Caulobacter phage BL57 TaxID=3348355 RepID=A0AB74UH01_9VIRU